MCPQPDIRQEERHKGYMKIFRGCDSFFVHRDGSKGGKSHKSDVFFDGPKIEIHVLTDPEEKWSGKEQGVGHFKLFQEGASTNWARLHAFSKAGQFSGGEVLEGQYGYFFKGVSYPGFWQIVLSQDVTETNNISDKKFALSF
jgi:hypothetical protein